MCWEWSDFQLSHLVFVLHYFWGFLLEDEGLLTRLSGNFGFVVELVRLVGAVFAGTYFTIFILVNAAK